MNNDAHCSKHGPHAPGECPQCDELAEARSIVATTYIPPARPSSNERATFIELLNLAEHFLAERQPEAEEIALRKRIADALIRAPAVGTEALLSELFYSVDADAVDEELKTRIRAALGTEESSGEDSYFLWFADVDVESVHFSGAGSRDAAYRAFEQAKMSWTCRLYHCVEHTGYEPGGTAKASAKVVPAVCGKPMPDGKGTGQCLNVPGHEGECDDMPM